MPLGLIARLRRCRRPAVVIAAGLIAVQAVLAGLALAQAALMPAPNSADAADFTVICHGNGGSGSDNGTAPDPGKTDPGQIQHPCCVSCAAGAPPATLPEQLTVVRSDRDLAFKARILCAVPVRIAPRAVRAGPSQGPPSLV
jgi:hypothetical protein